MFKQAVQSARADRAHSQGAAAAGRRRWRGTIRDAWAPTAGATIRGTGVDRVAVVRMFLSGESFLDQTRYYLGLDSRPPETFVLMGPAAADPAARSAIA